MIWREDAQFEFGAGGGVGRVGGRKFQVGGVLDGQDVFVGVGGVGGFYSGRFFGVALAGLLRGGAGGKRAAQVGKVADPASGQPLSFIAGRFAASGSNGSRRVWNIKFAGAFALSVRLRTVARFLMACEMHFNGSGRGSQLFFGIFKANVFFRFPRHRWNNSTFCQRGKCLACRHASSSHQSCPDARMGGRHLGDRPDRGRKSSAASANAAPAAPSVDLLYVQAGMERTKKRVFIFPQRNVTDEK